MAKAKMNKIKMNAKEKFLLFSFILYLCSKIDS